MDHTNNNREFKETSEFLNRVDNLVHPIALHYTRMPVRSVLVKAQINLEQGAVSGLRAEDLTENIVRESMARLHKGD